MKKYLIVLLLIFLKSFGQEKGIAIYAAKTIINANPECMNCFVIGKEILSDKPIFDSKDIDHFDWEEQQFVLSLSGEEKLEKLNIPLAGLPVIFVINGEPIYGFWFWTPLSSFGCDRVYTLPNLDFKLEFGLRDNGFGSDPRYDSRIKKYLENKN